MNEHAKLDDESPDANINDEPINAFTAEEFLLLLVSKLKMGGYP